MQNFWANFTDFEPEINIIKQQQQQFFIDQVDINSMQTVKIINTATWQGDSEKTKESPRQLPPHKHLIQNT